MFSMISPHTRAVLQALFVTFLWSTSWVLIKFGIREEIPALTFAGLRYTLAFLCLLPLLIRRRDQIQALRTLPRQVWLRLLLLGLIFYTMTQGAQFLGLNYLPAITVNLLLSLSAIAVAVLGIALLGERPTGRQWFGVALYLSGVLVYFYPVSLPTEQLLGVMIVLGGVLSNALASILGRSLNQRPDLAPLSITVSSMGIGALLLLGLGIVTQGLPPLSLTAWAIIGWLAVVNTAFAFTLWNHTLRQLSALESSIINNAMMIQIPILAWLFLGEALTEKVILGLVLAGSGILIVQLRRYQRSQ
ncbi:MAG: DMT family transporter [Anaerolineae bacterium]|nr:DMT family transporter [Anaerolineae bacterium]